MVRTTNPNEPKEELNEESNELEHKIKKDYRLIIRDIIHQKYSADDIEALMRHYTADPDKYRAKFDEYNAYCEEIVAKVKAEYGIED